MGFFQLCPRRPKVLLVCNHSLTSGVNFALPQCENDLPQASCLINLPPWVWGWILSYINLFCVSGQVCRAQNMVREHREFWRYYALKGRTDGIFFLIFSLRAQWWWIINSLSYPKWLLCKNPDSWLHLLTRFVSWWYNTVGIRQQTRALVCGKKVKMAESTDCRLANVSTVNVT